MEYTNNCNSNLLTKEELAIRLRLSVSTINAWIQSGKLRPIRSGRKCLFPEHLVNELLGLSAVVS